MFIFLGVLVKAVAGASLGICSRATGTISKEYRKGCRQDPCFMHRNGSDMTAREIKRTSIATNSTRQEVSLRPFKDLAVCGS